MLTVIAFLPSVLLANPIGHVRIAIKKNAVAGKQFTRLRPDESYNLSKGLISDGELTEPDGLVYPKIILQFVTAQLTVAKLVVIFSFQPGG